MDGEKEILGTGVKNEGETNGYEKKRKLHQELKRREGDECHFD